MAVTTDGQMQGVMDLLVHATGGEAFMNPGEHSVLMRSRGGREYFVPARSIGHLPRGADVMQMYDATGKSAGCATPLYNLADGLVTQVPVEDPSHTPLYNIGEPPLVAAAREMLAQQPIADPVHTSLLPAPEEFENAADLIAELQHKLAASGVRIMDQEARVKAHMAILHRGRATREDVDNGLIDEATLRAIGWVYNCSTDNYEAFPVKGLDKPAYGTAPVAVEESSTSEESQTRKALDRVLDDLPKGRIANKDCEKLEKAASHARKQSEAFGRIRNLNGFAAGAGGPPRLA